MRRPTALLAATIVVAGLVRPAAAQTEVEIRGSTTEYRFVEISHSFDGGLLLDGLYTGEPGMNEVYLGLGYEISPNDRTSVIPIAYAVAGREYGERGLTLGSLLDLDHPKWRLVGFVGHFFPTRGDIPSYTFVDSLDLTRKFGRWELGASAAAYEDEGDIVRVAGPVLKWRDRLGTWAATARFGDQSEFRVVRTLAF